MALGDGSAAAAGEGAGATSATGAAGAIFSFTEGDASSRALAMRFYK
jgi:hypothetical protein